MHLVLTDRLTCVRCGPTFGLILLADELDERRVIRGSLGCPNCRERYQVEAGFADLRVAPKHELTPRAGRWPQAGAPDEGGDADIDVGADVGVDAATLRQLLGMGEGPGYTLLIGHAAVWAARLAEGLSQGAEVVALDEAARSWPEHPGVNRLVAGPGIPFFSQTVRGVLLHGADAWSEDLAEAARVLAPRHRVVVLDAPDDAVDRLAAAGLQGAVRAGRLAAAAR